jgi:O-antigen ligase
MLKHFKLPDWLPKYGIALILLAIPLYPKFPLAKIPGTYVSIRLEDFLLAILALIFFVLYLPQLKDILKNRLERAILIFLGVGLTSLFSGLFLTQTVTAHLAVLHWLRRIEYFIPFFIGLFYFKKRKPEDLEFFLKVLMVAVLIMFGYGLGQKYFGWPVIITQNMEYSKGVALRWISGSHINSTFAGHYDLASFLVLVLPLFISLIFILKGRWTKISLYVTVLAGLWLLANAVSRISVVSYLLAASLALLFLKKYKEMVFIATISLLFFAFTSSLLARYTQFFKVIYQKLVRVDVSAQELPQRRENTLSSPISTAIFEDRSTSIRLNVEWPRAIRAFSKNPILGTGYSSITLATDNDFLRLLGEVGILGFIAFLLILSNLLRLIKRGLKMAISLNPIEKGFVMAFAAAFSGILLNACFIDIFEASKFAIIFWLLTGLFVSLVRNYKYEQNN